MGRKMLTESCFECFRIQVRHSYESNDHQVRFFGDGTDLIEHFWDDSLGLDPDAVFTESCQLRCGDTPHLAVIARCSCGVLGCGDIEVEISRTGDFVEWRQRLSVGADPRRVFVASNGVDVPSIRIETEIEPSARILKFLATDYFTEVERAINEYK
jgi:hypothetical protein